MPKYYIGFFSTASDGKKVFVSDAEQKQHRKNLKAISKRSKSISKILPTDDSEKKVNLPTEQEKKEYSNRIREQNKKNIEKRNNRLQTELPEELPNKDIEKEMTYYLWLNSNNKINSPESRKEFEYEFNKFYNVIGSGITFEKGKFPKKYNAIIEKDGEITKIPFGDQRYEQYKDRVPLKLYSHLDHKDFNRRNLYYKRHSVNYPKYSADWFSKTYLW